jgi:hypothetical protein
MCDVDRDRADWLGDHEHTHPVVDDAWGYARLSVTLMSKSGPAWFPTTSLAIRQDD